jgi:hypothetical protein
MHNIYHQIDNDHFAITLGKAEDFGTPNEELARIADQYPQSITVLVSGGADSEVMAKWMAGHGKDVTGVAYRFLYEGKCVNEHDLAYVPELDSHCKLVYKDINLDVFWESKWFWDFVAAYKCTSPQLPIQAYMAMVESMERFTILPAIHPEPKIVNGATHIQEREKDYSILAYLQGFNGAVSPLRSTPEMIASLISSPEFTDFHTFGVSDGRDRKHLQYKQWFDIDIKQRQKFHGFEGYEHIDNEMRERIFLKHGYSESWMFIPADEMLENFKTKETVYSTQTHIPYIRTNFHKLEKW